jgi:hypothetical protein
MALARMNIIAMFACLCVSSADAAGLDAAPADTPYHHRPALAKYEGDWEYRDDSTMFYLILRSYAKVYSPFEKSYSDYLFGWYRLEKKIGDSVITEQTLSKYHPSQNPMQVFFERGNDPGYDAVNLFPSMSANDRIDGGLNLMFKRISDNGTSLNIIAVLTGMSDTSIAMTVKPGDNIGFNHEMDQQVKYWKRISLPSEMKLVKVKLKK